QLFICLVTLSVRLFIFSAPSRDCDRRDVYSLPTRRSSDLKRPPWCLAAFCRAFNKPAVVVQQVLDRPGVGIHLDPAANAEQTAEDRKSTRLNSSHVSSSYAVFCLKNKRIQIWRRC